MVTGRIPALCLVCSKRCDGQFFCSDECYEKNKSRREAEQTQRGNAKAREQMQRLDRFFKAIG